MLDGWSDRVLWLLFKLLQATVAGVFTVIVLAQSFVCGLLRCLGGDPPALLKVEQARQHWACCRAREATEDDRETAIGTLDPNEKPMHVFCEPGHDSLAWQLVGPYMRQYGRHAIANSQLFNPEYIHFYLPGVGSLPYINVEGYNRAAIFGIGEPLAHRSQWRRITQAFLQEFPEAYFYHVTEEYADLLHDMGYYINKAGSETTLQVQSWTYSAKTRTVRAAARAARESGVRVRELRPEELTDEMRHKLQHDVSGDWHQQKAIADRQLRVFVRNVDYDTMQLRDGVRVFVAEAYDPTDAPAAFVDPVLQAAALNAKPPKPPRINRSSSSRSSSGLSRRSTSSMLALQHGHSNSCSSIVSLPSISTRIDTQGQRDSNLGHQQYVPVTPDASAAVMGDQAGDKSDNSSSTPSSVSPKSNCDMYVSIQYNTAQAVAELSTKPAVAAAETSVDVAAQRWTVPAQPELVGFVLLDPLWEAGREVGYVASLQRMKRSAHTGTLKLLYEDIISTLRQEGKQELTFGFAPLFNLRDGQQQRRYNHWLAAVQNYIFFCANNVYAFKNLAFSKVRYGGGLDTQGRRFRDPHVKLTDVYMATKHYAPGLNILDLYALLAYIGLIDTPLSVFAKLVGLTKGGANLKQC